MGESFLEKTGGAGLKLNDVIEDFKYVYQGQTVKAGDFVNYINGISGKINFGTSTDTAINKTDTYTGYAISATAMDDTKVVIVHGDSSHKLRAIVCKIDGITITYGTDTVLINTAYTGQQISSVKLDDSSLFVSHAGASSSTSSQYLYGAIIVVKDLTVSLTVNKKLNSTGYMLYTNSVLLSKNKVFIGYCQSSSQHLYGVVCTINTEAATITAGSLTSLSTASYAGSMMSCCALTQDNVFIAHCYGSNHHLYGIVCNISGTTITKGSDTSLVSNTTYTGDYISTCLLTNGNVFIAHGYETYRFLNAIVASVSGTTVSKGTGIRLVGDIQVIDRGMATNVSVVPLNNNNVLVTHPKNTDNYYLYGIMCTVNGTTITKGSDTQLITAGYSGYKTSPILLNNGTIFIAHSYSSDYYLYAQVFGIDYTNNIVITSNIIALGQEQQVIPATNPPFAAIALSKGVGGTATEHNEQVQIARLQQLIQDNIFRTTWTEIEHHAKYQSSDGTIVTVSGDGYPNDDRGLPTNMFDGDEASFFGAKVDTNPWVKVEFSTAKKITKMKIKVTGQTSTTLTNFKIQGSNSDSSWTDLYTHTGDCSNLTEVTLSSTNYYKYYRIYATTNNQYYCLFYEWQTTEVVQ